MSPAFLLSASAVLTGLVLGGAAAWLLPARENRSSAASAPASRNRPAAKADVPPADKPILTNRRARLLRLLNASTRGGGSSMAQAWKEATDDPAKRAWLTEVWLKADPAAFIQMICASDERLWTDANGMMVFDLITRFAQQDPQSAMRIGTTIQPPGAGRWIMSQAILKIMESNVTEGLALAAKHPELRLDANMNLDKIKVTAAELPQLMAMPRSGSVNHLMEKAMNGLPASEALKMTSQMNSLSRRALIGKVARQWAADDEAAALTFAQNEATDQQRVGILTAVGEKKAEENPAAAANWAMENLGGIARIGVLKKVAEKLEKTDPAAAEAIRARLPQNYNPKAK